MSQVAGRIALLGIPGAAAPLVGAVEMLPEITRGLARQQGGISVAPLLDDELSRQALKRSLQKLSLRQSGACGEAGAGREDPSAVKLLGTFLCYYGPVQLSWLQRTLALPDELLRETVHALEESGLALLDQLTEESWAPEICDAANLESLLRMLRRSRRPSFEALELAALPLFLTSFQGLTKRGGSLEHLRTRLGQLLGLPLWAGAWEQEVLPARIVPYSAAWLDSLMQTSDLLWFGCGPRKLSFAFPEELDLFQEEKVPEAGTDADLVARLIPDYLSFFRVLLTREFNPAKRIFVERINGGPAAASAYAEALKAFGFQQAYQGLELWRRY